ncbi:TGT domain-containing protein, partial [Haematococcus lacustris]
MEEALTQGAHAYLAVANTMPILASNRDPTMYEYGAKPSTDAGAYATIHCGGVLVRVAGGPGQAEDQ